LLEHWPLKQATEITFDSVVGDKSKSLKMVQRFTVFLLMISIKNKVFVGLTNDGLTTIRRMHIKLLH